MSEPKENRQRRHIQIADNLYKKVSVEAALKDTSKGKVIEEALKVYFGGEGEGQEN